MQATSIRSWNFGLCYWPVGHIKLHRPGFAKSTRQVERSIDLRVPDIDDVSSGIDVDLGLPRALLAGVRRVEDGRQLLEGLASRLHSEEVDDDNLDRDPDTIHDV